jgi:hypothetical protein
MPPRHLDGWVRQNRAEQREQINRNGDYWSGRMHVKAERSETKDGVEEAKDDPNKG